MDAQVNGQPVPQPQVNDPIQARLISQMKAARERATRLEKKLVDNMVDSRTVRRFTRQLEATQQWVIEALGFASKAELKKLVRAVEALKPPERRNEH